MWVWLAVWAFITGGLLGIIAMALIIAGDDKDKE